MIYFIIESILSPAHIKFLICTLKQRRKKPCIKQCSSCMCIFRGAGKDIISSNRASQLFQPYCFGLLMGKWLITSVMIVECEIVGIVQYIC